jgi:hypothetical protein
MRQVLGTTSYATLINPESSGPMGSFFLPRHILSSNFLGRQPRNGSSWSPPQPFPEGNDLRLNGTTGAVMINDGIHEVSAHNTSVGFDPEFSHASFNIKAIIDHHEPITSCTVHNSTSFESLLLPICSTGESVHHACHAQRRP